ncbi:MAG TPA: PIN domain-containing protein [Spirochaetales bacterium]|nr:PIN domain-containing protein [Spirochaetales bacterium]
MIKRVFLDSDVILDVATGREPFVKGSRAVLASIENGQALGFISSTSVTNIYYVLRKISNGTKARAFIEQVLKFLVVLPVTHEEIVQALRSDFPDFEDAVQHQCAFGNACEFIVTRNVEDYKNSKLLVYTPKEFVALLGVTHEAP